MIPIAVLVGKALRFVLRLLGGGSAVPGRAALLLEPKFLEKTIGRMNRGVHFVSGSNGKSTTTAMLVAVLRKHGLKVLTNPAGGNLPQGLASAVVADVNVFGRLDHDIAILEVDEAYGKLIAEKIAPNGLLLTNLQFDQLNRFHSPEDVLGYLDILASMTKDLIVVNGSDPNTEKLGLEHSGRLQASGVYASAKAQSSATNGLLSAPSFSKDRGNLEPAATLLDVMGQDALIEVSGAQVGVKLPAAGLHYAIDSALAIGMAANILGSEFDLQVSGAAISESRPVYGRGETISHKGQEIRIIMMKNLPSLQANLDALESPPECVWISVDEGTPDPSWIYDIDLRRLSEVKVISGTKTYQWATRLAYSGVPFGELIEDESKALEYFLNLPGTQKTAIINYEQMMWLRKKLGLLDLEGSLE
jgi:UDP-N-acetylmuramyl tripeptide synthase